MTYDPSCSRCQLARKLGRAALAVVAFTMPLVAARETGWLTEDPPLKPVRPDPASNATISVSAAVGVDDLGINGGSVVIRIDHLPDR